MTSSKKAALLFAAFCLFMPVAWAHAEASAPAAQTQVSKLIRARFEVLHVMSGAIQVRSLVNEREIHTFSYSDQIRDQMQKMLDQGGYQYGDKVVIWYEQGTEKALRIKGRPSKPH
jgi:hypothetical protein